MNIDNFWLEMEKYMKENDLLDDKDFPTLALYRIINETSLKDTISFNVMTNNNGDTNLVFTSDDNPYFGMHISSESHKSNISDMIDISDNLSIFLSGANIINNSRYEDFKNVMTDCDKKYKIFIYENIMNSTCLNDLLKIPELLDERAKKSLEFLELTYFLEDYQNINDKKHIKDLLYLYSSVNNSNISNIDGLSSYLYDYIYGNQEISHNVYTSNISEKHHFDEDLLQIDNDLVNKLNLEGSILKTIRNNSLNGKRENLIGEIFNENILMAMKDKLSYKYKITKKLRTLEEKANNPEINKFINKLQLKYPNFFLNDELNSYNQREYSSLYLSNHGISTPLDLLNKFKIIDDRNYKLYFNTHIYKQFNKIHINAESFNYNDRSVDSKVFVTSTDVSTKSIISGQLKETNYGNSYFYLDLVLMEKKPSEYSEMAFKQIFDYCKNNKIAIVLNKEVFKSISSDLEHIFEQLKNDYKKDVLVFVNTASDPINNLFFEENDYEYLLKNQDKIANNSDLNNKKNNYEGYSF